ncbi:MAG: haloacid dehalogenase type II [Nitrososphaerota archaeon]|nr:haloacid dehalogenase type II [Nitrososphaerota archaeon]MDG7024727.1 haloacid dehalogenase type II [Nitrososphaerota archaeon]
MGYRYLTFDCYGTLIDWRTGIERELTSVFGKVSLKGQELLDTYVSAEKVEETTYKKYREVLRRSLLSMSDRLGADVSDEAARKFAASVPRWPAFPDTAPFLREMGERGYRRYILSNVDNDLLSDTIRDHHLEVDDFVTAEQVGSYKPREGHWLEFLRRTGAKKEEVLHIAQSIYHDVVPTRRLGIDSVWVNRYSEPLPSEASPSMISNSLADLAAAIG